LVTLAARSYFDDLLAAGIKVHEYGPRMLHTKALLVDDHLVLIGSANFDHRSFRLNFEVSALLDSPMLADELERHLDDEFGSAPQVRRDKHRALFPHRLPAALARLLLPVLSQLAMRPGGCLRRARRGQSPAQRLDRCRPK